MKINSKKSIVGISDEVWNYEIGGYKVIDKWFKEHKGEKITLQHFTHIENMVGALSETIRLQTELSKIHNKTE